MTREEAIKLIQNLIDQMNENGYAEIDSFHEDALLMAIKALEQEPCEDEYIKVPKKTLKYRTAGMVAYNAEWLKNHFDIERAVICGAQQPILDKIRAEIDKARFIDKNTRICKNALASGLEVAMQIIDKYKAESEDKE